MVVPAALKVVRLKPTRKVSWELPAVRGLGLAHDVCFSRWSAEATGNAENA